MVLEFCGYSPWNSRINLVQKQVYNQRFNVHKPIVIAAVSKSFTNVDFNQSLMHQFRNLVGKIKEKIAKGSSHGASFPVRHSYPQVAGAHIRPLTRWYCDSHPPCA